MCTFVIIIHMRRIEAEGLPSFKKVLIIESNPQLTEILSTYLNFSGLAQDITLTNSLASAQRYLEQAKATKQPPQLLLTELQLRVGDTFALLKQLKADDSPLKRVPVVVMTRADDPII